MLLNFNENIKKEISRILNEYTYMRTNTMFKWYGLPDTVPSEFIEMNLQHDGHHSLVRDNDGVIYPTYAKLSNKLDYTYIPKDVIITNPYIPQSLNRAYSRTNDPNLVWIRNDYRYRGLRDLINLYNSRRTENIISIYMADINSRIQQILSANDSLTKANAETYIKGIIEGRIGVVLENTLTEGFRTNPNNTNTQELIPLIELEQFLDGKLLNELGLQSNFNMKRESINSNESQLNEDILYPIIDQMLECRKQACKDIKRKFNLDIDVEFNSSWKDNQIERHTELINVEEGDNQNEEFKNTMELSDNGDIPTNQEQ